MSIRYLCAKYFVGTFVKMALIMNNNIYICANLPAIFNLCKLYNHLMEICGSINK